MNPEPCPGVGLGFIPSKKSQNEIFLDGAPVVAGSLKPKWFAISSPVIVLLVGLPKKKQLNLNI
jgi:hypothetical protein